MSTRWWIGIVLFCIAIGNPANAGTVRRPAEHRHQGHSHGGGGGGGGGRWVAGIGAGLTISETSFLVSPALEYVKSSHFSYGALVQLGLASDVIFTGSLYLRFMLGSQRIKPVLEGALGLAVAGSAGIHIMAGLGVDYRIDSGISLGTVIRANFMPITSDSFMVSWPLLFARFNI